MNIQIDDNKVKDFFAEIVAIGIRRHEESLQSDELTINQSQAKRYLKKLGFSPQVLAEMVEHRLITPVKMGDERNSSVRFESARFYQAVDNMRLKRYITF